MLAVGQQPQGPRHPQLLQDGACVPPEECRCTLDPTVPGALNLSREEQEQEHAPGSRLQHRCNTCVCIRGAFNCSQEECDEEPSSMCRRFTELRNITKGPCSLPNVEVSFCSGRCPSRTAVTPEEPYLQTLCECCSYRLDPRSPVRILSLPCAGGAAEPVVLPIIRSCECSSCQGEWGEGHS
ncbi:UNVERIFIED_CONTAM: hypothetical protein H355_014453 [Colinus virginianus]|nr:hypothetical protein H355_014453 [Colinus virginianus]